MTSFNSRWLSHFWVKMHVFQLVSAINAKPVDKMRQPTCLCVILHVKHKKLPILSVTWFIILGKIQDGNHVWWRHRPPAAPLSIEYASSCQEDERLSTESKTFPIYCNTSKNQGRGFITPLPPPPPPCTTVEVWLCVYVRGLRSQISISNFKSLF